MLAAFHDGRLGTGHGVTLLASKEPEHLPLLVQGKAPASMPPVTPSPSIRPQALCASFKPGVSSSRGFSMR